MEVKEAEIPSKEVSPVPASKETTPEVVVASKEGSQEAEELPNNEEVREKKIITSEEEAKVRFFKNCVAKFYRLIALFVRLGLPRSAGR